MRKHALILLFLISTFANAQWLTLPNAQTGFLKPIDDFKINPFTNELWSAKSYGAGDGITKLTQNGTVTHYAEATLGNQFWIYGDIKIGFTPNSIYYSREQDGLYNLNNGNPNLVFGLQDIQNISNDLDTLYLSATSVNNYFYTFPNLPQQENSFGFVKSKNGIKYTNNDIIAFIQGNNSMFIWNQPYYINDVVHSFNFKKETDSLYIGFENGLSVCYKDQCYDTITPYNTLNMPSGKIAEIEFDKDDNLWCAFADFSPNPTPDSYHAIAKLEGNTWQVYDNTNTPFNWDAYLGMEIDTLGNVWVATGNNLHVLQSNSNPTWLNTVEYEKETFNVYPNPATDLITVEFTENITEIELITLSGKTVTTYKTNHQKKINMNTVNLEKGAYLIKAISGKHGVAFKKVILH